MIFRTLFLVAALAAGLYAQVDPGWIEPFPPHKVAGNVYYVGSKGLASYLITTPQGHILINSSLKESVPQIQASIETLGFKLSDVKILLISHAHWDHCAGSARIKALTGAKYMVMEADVQDIEAGGRTNFHYGGQKGTWYPPVKVDRVLHDGDEVKLGDAILVAHLTAGHTKGCTTWTWKTQEAGKTYNVVVVGSPNVNPGYKLVNNAAYPRIAQDYDRMFQVLKSLPCDIFLGAHGDYYGMSSKLAAKKGFVDPEGYQAYLAGREAAYRGELKKQQGK
jgi:metallo-beta-lactamase class B